MSFSINKLEVGLELLNIRHVDENDGYSESEIKQAKINVALRTIKKGVSWVEVLEEKEKLPVTSKKKIPILAFDQCVTPEIILLSSIDCSSGRRGWFIDVRQDGKFIDILVTHVSGDSVFSKTSARFLYEYVNGDLQILKRAAAVVNPIGSDVERIKESAMRMFKNLIINIPERLNVGDVFISIVPEDWYFIEFERLILHYYGAIEVLQAQPLILSTRTAPDALNRIAISLLTPIESPIHLALGETVIPIAMTDEVIEEEWTNIIECNKRQRKRRVSSFEEPVIHPTLIQLLRKGGDFTALSAINKIEPCPVIICIADASELNASYVDTFKKSRVVDLLSCKSSVFVSQNNNELSKIQVLDFPRRISPKLPFFVLYECLTRIGHSIILGQDDSWSAGFPYEAARRLSMIAVYSLPELWDTWTGFFSEVSLFIEGD